MTTRSSINYLHLFINSIKRWGLRHALRTIWSRSTNWLVNPLEYRYYKNYKPGKFNFQGYLYDYLYHPYNNTWKNERCVELPIMKNYLETLSGGDVLEVGNVLSHYFNCNHTVVDKYEGGNNVINADLIDFVPRKKYKLIICISTLEHVGFDEEDKDPSKVERCLTTLVRSLMSEGRLVYTIPLGFNPYLDKKIHLDKIWGDKYYLQKTSSHCQWKEVSKDSVINSKYNRPYPYANGLVVGVIKPFNL